MLNDLSFRIGGFVRVDSVNYPGLVACTVFTQGCNFRCPYCHNPSLVGSHVSGISREEGATMAQNGDAAKDFESFTVDKVFDYVKHRHGLLDAMVVSGGEPCLQAGLLDFLGEVKKLGLRTKLDTNGSFPDKLEKALDEGLLDYVAMDIKTSVQRYGAVGCRDVDAVRRSVDIVMRKAPDYEFRTTFEKGVVQPEDIASIGLWVKGSKRFFLQRFNPKVTLDGSLGDEVQYSYEDLEGFAKELGAFVDSVKIR